MIRWLAPLFFMLSASALAADKPVLRWGADIESGAPYSFKDPGQPDKIIGFESEIVAGIADELGMRVQFFQNKWEGLIEGLKRHDYDIVVNGLEITPDRAEVVHFSKPYYITTEKLTVRRTTQTVQALADLEGKRVGTLAASLAQRILAEQSTPMQIVTYSEEVHAYGDLAMGRLDAVFMDEAIALYYGKPNSALKIVGKPVGRLEYGVATRLENGAFSARVDAAVEKMIADGRMRRILEKWGLWNETTAADWKLDSKPQTPADGYDEYIKTAFSEPGWGERFERYVSFVPLLAKAAVTTLELSIIAMALAIVLGMLTALARLYGPQPFSWLAMAFVEIMRGTPLLIQLFLIFYGLPRIGIRLDPFTAAVLGLGLNYAASEAENYRAGIMSIPRAQMDASLALGMSWPQSLRHIVLPQAVRVVIPPVTNDFIALLKDSSLVSVITMTELTSTYGQLASTYFDYLGIGLLTAAVYFLIGLPFVRLSRYFESHLNIHIKTRR